jgi:GDP-4-dehydro-6-deoxy-D-mannose reductase
VKDMVKGYQVLMEKGVIGEVYNLGNGSAVAMQSIVDQLVTMASTPVTVQQESTRLRPSDVPIMQADITKVKQLGWRPEIPLSVTLQRILGYWRSL